VVLDATHVLFGDSATEITGADFANILSDSPGLAPLQDNGCSASSAAGPPGDKVCAPTHIPLITSPAINAGDNPLSLDYDQRGAGHPRLSGPTTDIGAIEYLVDQLFSDAFESD
jgi:hypothetical protein